MLAHVIAAIVLGVTVSFGTHYPTKTKILLFAFTAVVLFALKLVLASGPVHHRVVLNWHSPVPKEGVKVVSYNVYRSVTPKGPYLPIAAGVTSLTYTDAAVDNGKTYYYVVRSVDAQGRQSIDSIGAKAMIPH